VRPQRATRLMAEAVESARWFAPCGGRSAPANHAVAAAQ
jgi:hypothetical protein